MARRTRQAPRTQGARTARASAALARLSQLVAANAPADGSHPLALGGVYAIRQSHQMSEPAHGTQGPALCVVAQGAKVAMLGREGYEYDVDRMLIFSVDLPFTGQVTRASQTEPFLGVKLDLNPHKIAELAMKVYPQGAPAPSSRRGLYVGVVTAPIIDAVTRLLELMSQPAEVNLLGPLVVEEILIRLLRGPIGGRVAQIGQGSGMHRISQAISWVRANFSQAVLVEDLAKLAHMSVSSFHQRFKAVTSMSPLQYQKVLRLQEARRLMLFQHMDAGSACRQVGYASPSQFSQEYARLFGVAPTRDVARLISSQTQAGV